MASLKRDKMEALLRDDGYPAAASAAPLSRTMLEEGLLSEYRLTLAIAGQKANLYVILGIPKEADNGRLPAVLHIHGGGQTASAPHVRHWMRRGYVGCSYDWTGPAEGRDEGRVSDLGGLPGRDIDRLDPEHSVMLTRVLLAKSVLGWLAGLEAVDPGRLGVYGISWGGSITWLLNAWDGRLACAAPIYGVGHQLRPGHYYYSSREAHTDRELREWESLLDGVRLAGRQLSPLLMISATNDFWGWFDSVSRAMAEESPARKSLTVSANQDHHLDGCAEATLDAWMDTHLRGGSWPEEPRIEAGLSASGRLRLSAAFADEAYGGGIRQIRFVWSWGDYDAVRPPSRYWHVREAEAGESPEAVIPVPDPEDIAIAYCDIIYANGVKVSSLPVRISPAYMGLKEPDSGARAACAAFAPGCRDGWQCPVYRTEPIDPDFRYRWVPDPDGGWALGLDEPDMPLCLSTTKFADPAWRWDGEAEELELRLYSPGGGRWVFTAVRAVMQRTERKWSCDRRLEPGWSRIRLRPGGMSDERGKPMPGWHLLERLDVEYRADEGCPPDAGALLGSVNWVPSVPDTR